jgi:ABC-type multidrug transport system fused ATPase/permease subunit
MYSQVFLVMLTMLAALATAVVFGVGGTLVVHGAFQLGTLVAMSVLLTRVYGPIGQLSNVQVQVMTALVSFDRVFEVLDLKPLSGGEKQRVSLARLLLKAPTVVVLDEATAHLDLESEAAVQRALKAALAGRTSLVIAHRLSTIREADQILVVDDGQVLERGTHEDLLGAGGLYAELYHTQFASQETLEVAADPCG